MRSSKLITATVAVAAVGVVHAADFNDPNDNGGRWLTRLDQGAQLGEPLNIVISGDSDPLVLQVNDSAPGSFYTYWE